jgi:hypothetical protein
MTQDARGGMSRGEFCVVTLNGENFVARCRLEKGLAKVQIKNNKN